MLLSPQGISSEIPLRIPSEIVPGQGQELPREYLVRMKLQNLGNFEKGFRVWFQVFLEMSKRFRVTKRFPGHFREDPRFREILEGCIR